jgi:hypothetical protein
MLDQPQYKAVMAELEALTRFRSSVMNQIPKDAEGFYDRNADIQVETRTILVLMEELGNIEVQIRKQIKEVAIIPSRSGNGEYTDSRTGKTKTRGRTKKYL